MYVANAQRTLNLKPVQLLWSTFQGNDHPVVGDQSTQRAITHHALLVRIDGDELLIKPMSSHIESGSTLC